MPSEHRRDERVGVHPGQALGERRPRGLQRLSRRIPVRHRRRHDAQGIRLLVGGEQLVGKLIGEHPPGLVQVVARAADQLRLRRLIGVAQPALRIVDDADRRVAIGGDVHQAAEDLAAVAGE